MKFKNDISFLRAFSVVAVMLYHFKFTLFKGGFIGVDIFFVISGYLMTRIILTSFSKDNFKLLDFYGKRIARIFPALLVMIFFFMVVIYFFVPTQFIPYLESSFSSSLFFSNIFYYLNSGYFDASSQLNFLLHTWSLSVEWQFYMFYPLLLLLLKKTYSANFRLFRTIFFSLIVMSFIMMMVHNINDNAFSFFIFYTRAWEMMFGGLAFLYERDTHKLKQKYKNFIVIICILILAVCIYTIESHSTSWPSFLTIIPVASTSLILLLNTDFKFFKNKIVTFLGNISYSLYLWHWPIYVLSLYYGLHERLRYKIIFISLSIIFAIISYYLIEKKNYSKKIGYVLACSVLIFLGSFTLSKINPQLYFSKELGKLVDVAANYKYSKEAINQYFLGTRHLLHNQPFYLYKKNKLEPSKTKKNIILLGDSHAGMFSETVREIVHNYNGNLIQITADATFPEPNTKSSYAGPQDLMNYFFSYYFPKNNENIDLVVISANYQDYYQLDKRMNAVIQYFSLYNTKIIFIGQTMSYDIDFPTSYYLHRENKSSDKAFNTNYILKKRLGYRYIDLLNHPIKQVDKGYPYIYDSNHYTYYGTSQYKKLITHYLYN
ncbi:acyltransferase family protein [Chryseobacterium aureum]|uniref:acyltransferase family protein n=1 Tax=Chryseobacterium aureum TaxID=2497456 RepID=UPI000F893C93|nr:acyltransferase family protein [Chryseobacterium aureum]